jgi:drug/metabolite transporter (DMT)-like permease
MLKGVLLGLLMQCISAVGYLAMVGVGSIKSEWLRTSLMIVPACIIALVVIAYTAASGQQLSAIQPREYLVITVGSVMVMFVAQAIFFFGVRLSSLTTMTLTLLALPFITLALELFVGRIKPSSLGLRDLLSFVLITLGYAVYVSKPSPP